MLSLFRAANVLATNIDERGNISAIRNVTRTVSLVFIIINVNIVVTIIITTIAVNLVNFLQIGVAQKLTVELRCHRALLKSSHETV